MPRLQKLPEFASAKWYADPNDHRCPHDAWLESLQLSEPAIGERQEKRSTEIILTLLGAYHDGHIRLHYSAVTKYDLSAESCGRGLGDWLRDEFSLNDAGSLRHRIWWRGFASGSHWLIEAEDLSYEWLPKKV